jgi:hypothetical protein
MTGVNLNVQQGLQRNVILWTPLKGLIKAGLMSIIQSTQYLILKNINNWNNYKNCFIKSSADLSIDLVVLKLLSKYLINYYLREKGFKIKVKL